MLWIPFLPISTSFYNVRKDKDISKYLIILALISYILFSITPFVVFASADNLNYLYPIVSQTKKIDNYLNLDNSLLQANEDIVEFFPDFTELSDFQDVSYFYSYSSSYDDLKIKVSFKLSNEQINKFRDLIATKNLFEKFSNQKITIYQNVDSTYLHDIYKQISIFSDYHVEMLYEYNYVDDDLYF